jgi:hypothetical protein
VSRPREALTTARRTRRIPTLRLQCAHPCIPILRPCRRQLPHLRAKQRGRAHCYLQDQPHSPRERHRPSICSQSGPQGAELAPHAPCAAPCSMESRPAVGSAVLWPTLRASSAPLSMLISRGRVPIVSQRSSPSGLPQLRQRRSRASSASAHGSRHSSSSRIYSLWSRRGLLLLCTWMAPAGFVFAWRCHKTGLCGCRHMRCHMDTVNDDD